MRRAGPAERDVGCRVGVVHAVEVRDARGHRLAPHLLEPPLHRLDVGAARLDDDVHVVAVAPLPGQAEGGVVEPRRSLAPAVDEQHRHLGCQPEGGARLGAQGAAVEAGELGAQRHADRARDHTGGELTGAHVERGGHVAGRRAATWLARPATAPDSWISDGTRASRAPAINGMLA